MSLLPECPCCFGLMASNPGNLSSACRCGYPEVVTWDHAEAKRRSDAAFAEHKLRQQVESDLRFTIEMQERAA